MLPVSYFHVVFTLPSQLRDVAYQNKRVIYDLLMKAAAETTLAIAADPKRLGARIGITAVLHTWGSAMTHHPHVHMIVPGGGLSLDGARWVAARANFLTGAVEGIVTAAYLLTPHLPTLATGYGQTPMPGRLFHPDYRAGFRFGAVTLRPGMMAAEIAAALRQILADATGPS